VHAVLRATGDTYEIEGSSAQHPVTINGRALHRSRLRHGDEIRLGRTVFVFQRKAG
jgi:pSer/pThr/pTyr-binding forkhead associated (FHA) protein